jgi:7,8-dihydropterin-6-yl-methyl-4-(beta-D-ribofuranosyl)aminobenzene 5'-phosphate synthase
MRALGERWVGAVLVVLAAACASPPAQSNGNYIINLYDAFGPDTEGLTQDFGFSALVHYNGTTILFDSGTNADVLRANADALGVDLAEVDLAVASHAHFDHINGFDYLLEVNPDVKLYFPADVFWGWNVEFDVSGAEPDAAAALPAEQRYFGGAKEGFRFRQSGRFWGADVEYVADHTEIGPGMTLITTRSPYVGYFTRYPSLGGLEGLTEAEGGVKTIGLPELSLNLETPDGDVLLVGCSHSQVETIVRSTRERLDRPIGLVFGGYHMLPYSADEIRQVATRMRGELGVAGVAPTHCSGHAAFKVFREVFGKRYRMAGLGTTTAFP